MLLKNEYWTENKRNASIMKETLVRQLNKSAKKNNKDTT